MLIENFLQGNLRGNGCGDYFSHIEINVDTYDLVRTRWQKEM